MDSKRCTKCKEIKPLTDFNTRPDRPSGYRSECKKCQYKGQHKGRIVPVIRARAYSTAHYAKKAGVLEPPDGCEDCNEIAVLQMHHDSYEYPLSVRWLCAKCHTKFHCSVTNLSSSEGATSRMTQCGVRLF